MNTIKITETNQTCSLCWKSDERKIYFAMLGKHTARHTFFICKQCLWTLGQDVQEALRSDTF